MATILLSAAGAAIGSGFGGTLLGLSGAVIGRAVGATAGRVIDQRLLGMGSDPVETGQVEQFRLVGATDGAAVAEVWGRTRIGGQVIWATRFLETQTSSGGGKGTTSSPSTTAYSYSVSLAIALCRGEIRSVGRIWADGMEIAPESLALRVYSGSEDQMPDPKIETVEGAGLAPAFRGIAYVVIEDLALGRFGNRVPQFTFEVVRPAQGSLAGPILDIADAVRAVALIPGTGEYALATTPLYSTTAPGVSQTVNVHSASGLTDFTTSFEALQREMPGVGAVSLVVSWFGSDLRCGSCTVQPKVEPTAKDAAGMAWNVSGQSRAGAEVIPSQDGLPVYGGTPTDASVVQAISAIKAAGKAVTFYPFILMDQVAGNLLTDPFSGLAGQPALPWRGRITTSLAPGLAGSPDRTSAAEAEVAAFLGAASVSDFAISGSTVTYSGPSEWRFRRMILHYAHLCAAAGGVDAFLIGSELRGLTQVRGAADSFPMAAALKTLAAEVKSILPAAKVSYAADWSEYFGYQADGNVYFHLDPLWSDPNVDFVGIDNYMPLADWRDGAAHADAAWGSIYNLDYLKANIEGGEGFDWYYDGPEGVLYQNRKPIQDGAYGEDWVYRYKDIRNWWTQEHHERLSGARQPDATPWVPQSKPIWFTEYGCAALDKAANQPNVFLDPKSSESALPRASNGQRDDYIQLQYLRAIHDHWTDPAKNPISTVYGEPMIDMDRAHVWAWDARPYPEFPGQADVWGDAANYHAGHWLNGRVANQPLPRVIAEICDRAGVTDIDPALAHGVVHGYALDRLATARSALQVLSLGYGFDPVERDGVLQFRSRDGYAKAGYDPDFLVFRGADQGSLTTTRQSSIEQSGRVRISFFEADSDFDARTAESVFPDDSSGVVTQSDLPLVLTGPEARSITERWLAEARVARDIASFALPRSAMGFGAGDVIDIGGGTYRIDRIEQTEVLAIDAVRVDPGSYGAGPDALDNPVRSGFAAPLPVFGTFLDLPLITGDEVPQAPHVAVTADPWPGTVAVWSAPIDDGYALNTQVPFRAVIGATQSTMSLAASGVFDRGAPLRVLLSAGQLSSVSEEALLSGPNLAALGDGTPGNWELFQFATATLVAPNTYDLTDRLRGQFGTDGLMPAVWPVGSIFVLIDGAVPQINLPSSLRGVSQYYRVGAEAQGYAAPTATVQPLAFDGVGLRPYSVTALAATGAVGSTVTATWIRRTRVDGDNWDLAEVPLGETSELYSVWVVVGSALKREVQVTSPSWTYTASEQAADGVSGAFDIAVAQVSDRFGNGPFVQVSVA
jgi:hypothetical protein